MSVVNAFTIPAKSAILDGNRHLFPSKAVNYKGRFQPISLPGSSKEKPPSLQKRPK